ncbi:MAG: chromosome segregation protein SMC [Saprospiraceae bacterium]
MQLKSLEIKGFKSFANDTIINFNEAVTGIVGPNGSGKSNVVDAIRWVLGEQKGKELRLEAMSDVIFNGTKKRREAPMAQVTLSFDNTKNIIATEYQTVSVSRLLYRSGESEYRLNNVACRLKDITSLFLDTGVGPDSYSIIALNMVEDLLSNKENARRKMFEQAAGISKYKTRKKESINKLKATTEDLARIEDLLFEINNNLLELEKQAKRAKKFYEMRDKFRSAGLVLSHISIANLNTTIRQIELRLEEEMANIQAIEVNLRTQEAELEKYKHEHLDQEKNLSEHQKQVNVLLDKLRQLESDIQIKQQRKTLFESQISQITESDSTLEKKLNTYVLDINSIDSDILLIDKDIESAESIFAKLEVELLKVQQDFNLHKFAVDKKLEKRQEVDISIFNREKDIAIYSNQIENLNSENRRMKEELNSRSNEFINAEKYLADNNSKLQLYRTKLNELLDSEAKRKESISLQQSKIDQQIGAVNAISRSRDAKQNEFDRLKSMVERMEGFPESMKYLNASWKQNVPVLSDVISVNEKHRPAIELFLEPYLNYYLVVNDKDAIDAISLLHRNSKGKANFFIINQFDFKFNQILPAPSNSISAVSLVECDAVYQNLISHLLANVFIANQDVNIEDYSDISDGISLVNANGTFLKQRKSISGGSSGLFEGKRLGRRKNLEKLELEIKELSNQLILSEQNLNKYRTELKVIEQINYDGQLTELRKEESIVLQQITEYSTKYNGYKEFKNQIDKRILDNEIIFKTNQANIENANIELNSYKEQQLSLLSEISNNDLIYTQVSLDLSKASTSHNQANLDLLKLKNKSENLQKDKHYRNNQKLEVLNEIETNKIKIEELSKSVLQLNDEISASLIDLDKSYAARKQMQDDLSNLEQSYYEVRNFISISDQSIKDLQRNIYELQSSINGLKEKRSDSQYRISSTTERAELEFGTKFENFVADEETLQMDEGQLADRVNYYKVRLDNYGEINPLALEAYDEMKVRYDLILVQREDILKAKESLLETIKEIEETAIANFMESFNKVRDHFQTVFRSLFTEDDDCDLILLDELDPLECDIDIIAKPKGKRPKSISQLSGGEKTLTAIALLFSLYLLKPAPFCIFDEVDAPLDDINIEKFNKIVRQFSKDSQFIIITHNKLTMAEVDVLYGVYMEEQGISSVTAVDFRKYDYDSVLSEIQG